MDALLHYPPPYNPDYERESMAAFDAWDAERRVRRLGVVVDWLECAIWNLEGDLRFNRAEVVLRVLEKRRAEYKRLKQQLAELEDWG